MPSELQNSSSSSHSSSLCQLKSSLNARDLTNRKSSERSQKQTTRSSWWSWVFVDDYVCRLWCKLRVTLWVQTLFAGRTMRRTMNVLTKATSAGLDTPLPKSQTILSLCTGQSLSWNGKKERCMAGWKNEGSVHLLSSPEELSFLSGAEEEEKIFSFSPHINKFSEGERGVVVVVVVVLVAGGLEISINKMKKELC